MVEIAKLAVPTTARKSVIPTRVGKQFPDGIAMHRPRKSCAATLPSSPARTAAAMPAAEAQSQRMGREIAGAMGVSDVQIGRDLRHDVADQSENYNENNAGAQHDVAMIPARAGKRFSGRTARRRSSRFKK
jgi:hypothetical protein